MTWSVCFPNPFSVMWQFGQSNTVWTAFSGVGWEWYLKWNNLNLNAIHDIYYFEQRVKIPCVPLSSLIKLGKNTAYLTELLCELKERTLCHNAVPFKLLCLAQWRRACIYYPACPPKPLQLRSGKANSWAGELISLIFPFEFLGVDIYWVWWCSCNPSYLEGGGRMITSSRKAWAKLVRRISKAKYKQQGCGHCSRGRALAYQVQGPGFNPRLVTLF
jgi:hypothetical protein